MSGNLPPGITDQDIDHTIENDTNEESAMTEIQITISENELIYIMQQLFTVWDGTKNADEILTDTVATFGHQLFGKTAPELRILEAKCRLPL